MSEEQQDRLVEYLRKVTADLRRARRRIDELESRADEPIAVVGMGCRLPGGVASPEDLWRLVEGGEDAVTGFPTDRGWDLAALHGGGPGGSTAQAGGFLTGATEFDAEFFGISPREAAAMDLQQRLLLEVVWETVERAGIDPHSLRGTRAGVYVGTYGWDPGRPAPSAADGPGHLMTGTAASVLSGRIAYLLGLQGPALTLDTACSSSLVALHTAVRALRAGEATLALVGGVTVLSDPAIFPEFSRQGGLSPDGRCKAFADTADGTGWAEGVGALLIERLSDARRNGHPVLAVVRGTAVNSDGASNGLTAPSGPAQQRVIRQALEDAGLTPAEVDAVEAHGTGTKLGDPIEAQALLATYGQGRAPEHPLWLGSLKSNIGHTQAAAGVAGVIKMVQALRHGVLPATLHADRPSTAVDWSAGRVELLREPVAWPRTDRERRAAVSAFGISGTNAHAVLAEAPEPEPAEAPAETPAAPRTVGAVPWPVSARSAPALAEQIARIRALPGARPLDVGYSLATGRSAFEHRAVLLGSAEDAPLLAEGVAEGAPPLAVLFSGQGSQRPGMGRELAARFPVFAEALEEVWAELARHGVTGLREVMWGSDPAALDRTGAAQPALFAHGVALHRLVTSWGLRPDHLAGHSIGEVTAAYAAGVLSLPNACRLVAARASLMEALPPGGAMVALAVGEEEVAPLLTGTVALAAVNGPRSTVIAGPADEVAAVAAELAAAGRRTSTLRVSHAFHSPLMEPMLADFRAALEGLEFAAPAVPLVSNLTGRPVTADELGTPDYWVRHVRGTVRFHDGVRALAEDGAGAWLELGPGGVLAALAQETLPHDAVVTPLLHPDRGEEEAAVTGLGRLYAAGVPVDWAALLEGSDARRVDLPTYPFQRERFTPRPVGDSGEDGTGTAADPGFWSAVERQDAAALARRLELADDTPVRAVLPALASWRSRHRTRTVVDSWRHRVVWRRQSLPRARLTGSWLVIIPADPVDPEWTAAVLAALGDAAVPLVLAPDTGREALAARLAAAAGSREPTGIVSLLAAADGPTPPDGVPGSLPATAGLLQAAGDAGIGAPLWCLTRDATAVRPTDRPTHLAHAALWGLGRVAAQEYPDRWGGLVDLPAEHPDARVTAALAAVLAGRTGEDQVALRLRGSYVRRLVPVPLGERGTADTAAVPRVFGAGTTLVTGGTGGLGGQLARRLAREGAQRLLLVSRRGPAAEGADELAREVADLGAEVEIAACDVGDRDALAALLAAIPADRPLTAVVHAAGVLDDGVLERLTPERFAEVHRAKAGAALLLDELTRPAQPAAFVLFSSVSGTVGTAGQANYAAANTLLDALAVRRRAEGLPATAIAWGGWGGGEGMAGELDGDRLTRSGLGSLDPELALTALLEAVTEPHPTLVVAELETLAAAVRGSGLRPTPLLDELPRPAPAAGRSEPAGPRTGGLLARLRDTPPAEHAGLVLETVRTQAAAALGHGRTDAVGSDRAFRTSGFDSLTAVALRNRLVAETGLPLAAGIVFDHPTPRRLTAHLLTALAARTGATAEAAPPVGGGALQTDSGAALGRPADPGGPEEDPVVVVGMACRLPGGADTPERLWQLLTEGRDGIGAFPTDRGWDLSEFDHDGPWQGSRFEGGFLYDAADFDAGFFGVPPREALTMDPQQRLLLEVAWEAVERSGTDPRTLRGSRTGVFVGSNGQDYAAVVADSTSRTQAHAATGLAASVLSGRISYNLGLEGPAVTVDTACSSSLVALHQAVRALRSGECVRALAGGATVMTDPASFARISRLGAIAGDGRSKAFADGADGTGYSEGAVMLLVERLSTARRDGHRPLAVIRGIAVNQDGASNGLTAPHGPSQQTVIRQALADAALTPADVDAVEAHGTGTRLGDPIEAEALLAVYGSDRAPGRPLWLGSLKSNIGHTQAAAGAAGVLKMVLALQHASLPRTLHAERPSTRVDWSAGTVALLQEPQEWAPGDRLRRAGVSAFGISGTNAHVLLEEPPAAETAAPEGAPDTDPQDLAEPDLDTAETLWPLAAETPAAVADQAARLARFVRSRPTLEPAALGWSLATTRTALAHRAVATGADRDALLRSLDALASGTSGAVHGPVPDSDLGPVFVFPGQGSQWWGMGRELLATSRVFEETVADCADAFAPHLDWSLTEVLTGTGKGPELYQRADVVQPALFTMMVALAAVWRAHGVEPGAVVGHSQGEVAAAYVAGAFSLDDAARLVAQRSRVMLELDGHGGLMSVAAPADRVQPLLARWPDRIALAVLNGPASVVVSGDHASLAELVELCAAEGLRTKHVRADIAGHGPQVEAVREQLLSALGSLRPRSGTLPFYSTVTGDRLDTAGLDADYWYANLRQTVRMEAATRALVAAGHRLFLESSPHPVLAGAIGETCEDAGVEDTAVLGSLRRDDGGPRRMRISLGEGWTHGLRVDWRTAFPAEVTTARPVELPTYPFQRRRYWPEARPAPTAPAADATETAFWELVEGGDPTALAEQLRLDDAPEALAAVLPALADWRVRARQRADVDAWCYRSTWTRLPDPPAADTPQAPAAGGHRIVVVPAAEADDPWVTAALAALGPDTVRLDLDPASAGAGQDPAAARTALAARLADHLPGATAVLSLLALAEEPGDPRHPAVPAGLAGTLTLLQALGESGADLRLWCATRDAVAALPEDRVAHPVQATVWGLGRVVALEQPALWGGLVDLPAAPDPAAAARLAALVTAEVTEDQVAIRSGGAYGRRLLPAAPATGSPAAFRIRGGTALVTGGTGALGERLAHWAVDAGAEHLLLTSRRGPQTPDSARIRAELEQRGVRVTVAACDAADREALAARLASLPDEFPLRTVIHAAGVSDGDAPAADLTPAQLDALLRAKLTGARNLHELTLALPVESFVLFSSGAASWGSGGQPGYAAANAHLDALAEHRRAAGLPATSIAWGAWGESGMATAPVLAAELARRGVHPMEPATALAALTRILAEDHTTMTVTAMEWEKFLPAFTASRPSPLLADLPESREPAPDTGPAGPDEEAGAPSLRDRLADLPDVERTRLLVELVRTEAAATLGHTETDAVPAGRALRDLGFDSVSAVELRNRLKAVTGLPLPAALVFDHPHATAIAALLRTELFPDSAAGADADAPAGDDQDTRVRAALATIPTGRLREAGLLDLLLQLADGEGETGTATGSAPATTPDHSPDGPTDLDELDGESLLRLAAETAKD